MKKRCPKCKERKSFFEFYKDESTKSGFTCYCKECLKNYARKRSRKYYQTRKKEYYKYGKNYRKTVMGCLRHRFQDIKQRCNNPKNAAYKHYGGRGIKCLFKSSDEFVNYVINELQIDPRRLQIDRIDNNGNYEKGNIRFTTAKINLNNKRKKYHKL